MRLVRERTVRIKEIWDVPDDLELDPDYREDAPGVTLVSQRSTEIGAAVLRPADVLEPAEPAPDPKHQEAAERGYWSRLVRAWENTMSMMPSPREFQWHWPLPEAPVRGRRFWYDIETNGLLDTVSTIHSLVLKDIDTGEVISCAARNGQPVPGYPTIEEGLALLEAAEMAVGHNVLGYDRKALRILYPSYKPPFERDTLVLAKAVWPADYLKELDFPRWRKGTLPGNLIGTQGLESWGYRMGRMKGEYSKTVKEWSKQYAQTGTLDGIPEDFHCLASTDKMGRKCLDPWMCWNKPMQDYCEQDVDVTAGLWGLIIAHLTGKATQAHGIPWSPRAIALEHDVWVHCMEQEERGFGFNIKEAVKEAAKLKSRQSELEALLRADFGDWWQPFSDVDKGELPAINRSVARTDLPHVTIARYGVNGKRLKDYVGPPKEHYSTDAPFVKIKRMQLNPKSRRHIGDRLQAVFGWQPSEWVGKNEEQAKVDETTIREMETSILPERVKDLILEYLVVSKFLGQLADGSKSWIDLCGEDGRLHGRVDPLGTITHRGAHKAPNLAQVPAISLNEVKDATGKVVSKEIKWGWKGGFGAEARGLFVPGYIPNKNGVVFPCQTGTDASGLELRLLGHHLYEEDGGEYARMIATPGFDIHSHYSAITGLTRAETKTTTYAFLYGAGNLKIGIGVGVKEEDIDRLANSQAAKNYVRWMQKLLKDKFTMPDRRTLALVTRGGEVSRAFQDGITGLKEIKKSITAHGEQYGFIIAIDGRKLRTRKAHAALNTQLQGDGAVVCKEWMMEVNNILVNEEKLRPDWDFGQVAFVHDELGIEHQEGLQEIIAKASAEAMQRTALALNFRGELAVETKHGKSWKETH